MLILCSNAYNITMNFMIRFGGSQFGALVDETASFQQVLYSVPHLLVNQAIGQTSFHASNASMPTSRYYTRLKITHFTTFGHLLQERLPTHGVR